MGWPMVTLEAAAEIRGGGTPRREDPTYWNGGIPWLTPSDLPPVGAGVASIRETADSITEEGLASSAATLLPPGTVLFSSRASIGKVGIAAVPVTTNQGFANLIPRRGVEPRYLAWCVSHHAQQIASLAGSTTFREVTKSALRRFRIPLPPPSEQRRIVDILDQADLLLRLRAEADAKADRILPALFRKMFGDPATNPMGWPVVPLRQLGKPLSGGAFPRNEQGLAEGEVPFIKVSDMNTEGNEWYVRRANNFVSYATLERLRVKPAPPGTVVFPKIGAAIATNKKRLLIRDTAFDNNVIGVVPHEDAYSAYLFGFFRLFDLRTLARSTAVPSIKSSELENVSIPRPSVILLEKFSDLLVRTFEMRSALATRKQQVEQIAHALTHQTFAGSLTSS